MAAISLKGFWVGDYSETTAAEITISNGKKLAKAVSFSFSNTVSTADMYGDDSRDDSDAAVTKATITLTPTGLTLEELEDFIGMDSLTVKYNGKEHKVKALGSSNESGRKTVGIIIGERRNGVETYETWVYPNVKFRPPESQDFNTKGESLSFSTNSYAGECFDDLSKEYVHKESFTSEDLALASLNEIFDITTSSLEG
jgi:phi13 family phage major tail protein